MITLLRIAAVLSFLCPFVGGVGFVGMALSSPRSDAFPIAAFGLFLIGMAFFVGSMLFIAAEKLSRNGGSK
jgi:hypothetical protein